MNSNRVARAVAHWVGFESACFRENLLSEASLSHPVGQCLKVISHNKVEPEYPHPQLARRRIDMAIEDAAVPGRLVDAVEMKFTRLTGRDYSQEIFDDLVRLECIPPQGGGGTVGRWLLIAGVWHDIEQKVINYTKQQPGVAAPVHVFHGILPTNLLLASAWGTFSIGMRSL